VRDLFAHRRELAPLPIVAEKPGVAILVEV
jgi:hypothetical protein